MPTYTYEQLKDMKVAELREIAKDLKHDSLEGYTTMHKEHLIPILCKVLDIHMHHAAAGAEKTRIKAIIHKLQAKRDEAITSRKTDYLPEIRQQIHVLKRKLRRMADAKV